ncbi:MAG: HEAT repeat domain-containing protein [Anaerolineae bacterium]|nr:HEAT repeat domain-containing protein [Anaerolineae bacterium]
MVSTKSPLSLLLKPLITRNIRILTTGYQSKEGATGITERHKRRAALVLKLIGRSALPYLLETLTHRSNTNEFISGVLARIGQPAIVAFMEWLGPGHSANQRRHAVAFLGEWHVTAAVAPLIALLRDDPDYQTRIAVTVALGKLGQPEAIPALLAALQQDEHESVRLFAARALGQFRDPATVKPLIAALGTEDTHVQAGISTALAELGDARALDPILATLATFPARLRDRPHDLCWRVIAVLKALATFGDPRIAEPITAAVRAAAPLLDYVDERDTLYQTGNAALEAVGQPPIFSDEWLAGPGTSDAGEV